MENESKANQENYYNYCKMFGIPCTKQFNVVRHRSIIVAFINNWVSIRCSSHPVLAFSHPFHSADKIQKTIGDLKMILKRNRIQHEFELARKRVKNASQRSFTKLQFAKAENSHTHGIKKRSFKKVRKAWRQLRVEFLNDN